MVTRDDIDPEPTPGRHTSRLYRRVNLDRPEPGIVRYEPELEAAVPDVRAYIADWLTDRMRRLGVNVVRGELVSPLDVPLPGDR